jgi:hypothetical protein
MNAEWEGSTEDVPEDKGMVVADVFTALSNMNGVELGRRHTSLAMNETPDFKLGGDRAMIIFGYLTNKLKNEQQYNEVLATRASRRL